MSCFLTGCLPKRVITSRPLGSLMGKNKTPITTERASKMQSAFDKQIAAGKDASGTIGEAKSRVMSAAAKNKDSE